MDVQGWYRHSSTPCCGAYEYAVVQQSADTEGRVTQRTIASRTYTLTYGPQGRLTTCTSPDGDTITYEYDHLGRRVKVYPVR